MAQTIVSSGTSLCPVEEFLKRVDNTAIGTLCSDQGGFPISPTALLTDENVLAALMTATGYFESAVMMGGKYSADDLQALLATTCGSQAMMFDIISDLAWMGLFKRRPNMQVTPPASLKQSMEWLDMLAQGKRIFAFTQTVDATIMERSESSVNDITQQNGVVVQAEAYYGRRCNRSDRWTW